jgi:hypothetical protein
LLLWKAASAATEAEIISDILAGMTQEERALTITKSALKMPHTIGNWK